MPSTIVIVGSGFAGLWSALSARRLIHLRGQDETIQVVVVAPEPALVLRPRLYEADAASMKTSLEKLFRVTGVRFVQGSVRTIDTEKHVVSLASGQEAISYDRLILAAGSRLVHPASVAGLEVHAFNVDQLDSASKLEAHLRRLASLPASPARDTIVVGGAGFTGIELATELPERLRSIFGNDHIPQVVLVGNSAEVGPELGPGPRPIISDALRELGVQVKLGAAITAIDADGVTLATGERISTMTAVWTAGVAATPLTQQIQGERDAFGRLRVNPELRVPTSPDVFATGDAACARTGADGPYAMMSCQHAQILGRVSGHNAAADLLGEPATPYSQPSYLTCLDLGAYGAVLTQGWDRSIMAKGAVGKKIKNYVNREVIYPPPADAAQAFAAAEPVALDYTEQLTHMIAMQVQ
ncbi:hypothetical protein S40288_05555 [Stachybotrys chartarum IBT 40288]|nr:hypothetical protein S40288_05555 [Stachybotrys chartarum IBT 40288]